jgi:hypothetical protein
MREEPMASGSAFPAVLADIEVLGVLHRKGTAAGIEGRVTAPVSANLFRDCAGQEVMRPEVGTFSAATGLTDSPLIAKHEFGHAHLASATSIPNQLRPET